MSEEANPEEGKPEDVPKETEAAPVEPKVDDKKKDKIKKDKKKQKEGEPKKRKTWLWVVIGLVVVLIIAFIPLYYTSSPEACNQCHSMNKYYTSWQKSWHGKNETACSECHVRPGWLPYLTYRIGFYREIFAEIFSLDLAPWGATSPGEASCTRGNCHSTNRLSSSSGDIKVNHEAHSKKAKKKCSYCHAGASHEGIKGLGLQLPPRRQCFLCHKDKAKQCDFCHTIKYKPGTVPKTPHY
ncbi:MAG: NapC/NirT family cytochrome c [Actinomycetota bacterium]